jgi:membrane protease YdiL (CAAX protease family)
MASEPGTVLGLRQEPRRGLRAWVARHALVAFFGLTYAISWAIWLSEPLLEAYDPVGSEWYGMLALFGPALAAIILATVLGEGRVPPAPLGPRLAAATLTLGAALWANWGQLDAVWVSPHQPVALALWLALTLLPTWLVWLAGGRGRGLRGLLGSLTHWRHHYNHYLLALLLIPVAGLAGIIVLRVLGEPWPRFPRTEALPTLARDLVFVFVSSMLYGGGLAEEPGWRGFALPRLQEQFDPLTASVILSIAWSVWYVPLHLMGVVASGQPFTQGLVAGLALRLLSVLPVTVAYTWLANRTRGSLLLLVIMHASATNTLGWWLPMTGGLYLGLYALVPVLVALDRMWRRRIT